MFELEVVVELARRCLEEVVRRLGCALGGEGVTDGSVCDDDDRVAGFRLKEEGDGDGEEVAADGFFLCVDAQIWWSSASWLLGDGFFDEIPRRRREAHDEGMGILRFPRVRCSLL